MSHVVPRRPVRELLLYIFACEHLFIEASHRTSFRIFGNLLLRDVFPENYKEITILLYLSSCAVETVPVKTRVVELQLCMTKMQCTTQRVYGKRDLLKTLTSMNIDLLSDTMTKIYSKVSNAMEK